MGIGSPANPYVETWFAGRIVNVHWDEAKPGEPPPRLVLGLTMFSTGGGAHGVWTLSESGTEVGSAACLYPGFGDSYGVMTLDLISFSGAGIFSTPPPKYLSVAPGAAWSMSLSLEMQMPPPPIFGGPAITTVTANTINPSTGAPNGSVLSVSGECEPGATFSLTLSASGVAPK